MNAMKKTVLATAVVMSMGASVAQAAPVVDFAFEGNFVMFYATATNFAPWSANPAQIMPDGDAGLIQGTMHMDYNTMSNSYAVMGGGTLFAPAQATFGGESWFAGGTAGPLSNNIALTALASPGQVQADMLFNWGAAAATSCGVVNCDIGVSVVFQMFPVGTGYDFYTLTSSMPGGPFGGMQPTFNGHAEVTAYDPGAVVPVPAAAWLLGSGLIGLVGVARRKAA